MELLRRSCEAPVQADGVRRSKMVIVRNTLSQLKTTCLVSVQQLLRPVITYKVSDATIQLRMPGIESDWLLLPLDTEQNIQRLLSLELTAAWCSEFREIPPEIVQAVLSRCGRYPSRAMLRPEQADYWYGLIMETNSFSEDSPWFEALEVDRPANWEYFIQPGAFAPGAENRENLPPRYYEDLMESNTEEWSEQYIHNRITPSLSGTAVFRNTFSTAFHVSPTPIIPMPGYPLILGTDTGRNPAVLITQLDDRGRLLVLKELFISNMGMDLFLDDFVTPELATDRFCRLNGYMVLDPAGRTRSQIGEESVLSAVQRHGYEAILAMTNSIDPRIRAVEKFLSGQKGGGPAILIDADGCPMLILALQSRYRYKLKKNKEYEEKPEKLHPWSDLCFVAGTPISAGGVDTPIENIRVGMQVDTPAGPRPVMATGHREVDSLVDVALSTGETLRCTPNHPFVLPDGSTRRADALQYGTVLEGIGWRRTRSNFSVGGAIAAMLGINISGRSGTPAAERTGGAYQRPCTVTCGHTPTAQFQMGSWCITSTTNPQTTHPKTSRWWKTVRTAASICVGGRTKGSYTSQPPLGPPLHSGMGAKPVGSGTPRTGRPAGMAGLSTGMSVLTAARITRSRGGAESGDSALRVASPQLGGRLAWITKRASAIFAAALSPVINMPRPKRAVRVVGVKPCPGVSARVFNLTVADVHQYYAGGVLVANCDALQYACLGTASGLRGRALANLGYKSGGGATPEPGVAGWT